MTGIITVAELLIAGPDHWLVGTWVFWGQSAKELGHPHGPSTLIHG